MAGGIPVRWSLGSYNDTYIELQWAVAQLDQPRWRTWASVILPAHSTDFRLAAATPGTLYYFQVRACNVGGCSPFSNLLTASN